jgi:hypothetical protein
MYDAEIAAVLLNRYTLAGEAAADLMREGNLEFVVERGDLESHVGLDSDSMSLAVSMAGIEALRFTDGSRVVRIAAGPAIWTQWTAVLPPVPAVPVGGFAAHGDLALTAN